MLTEVAIELVLPKELRFKTSALQPKNKQTRKIYRIRFDDVSNELARLTHDFDSRQIAKLEQQLAKFRRQEVEILDGHCTG